MPPAYRIIILRTRKYEMYNLEVVSVAMRPAWRSGNVGEWLSLVEHLVRDQGVGGSNPLSPTTVFNHLHFHDGLELSPWCRFAGCHRVSVRFNRGLAALGADGGGTHSRHPYE